MLDLASGHEGSIPQTREEIRTALAAGLVSLDANVLLSFYRFSTTARVGLINVLEALGDRVFVTHQAAREFWRNRLAAIDARTSATEQFGSSIDKAANQVRDAVRVWAKQTAAEAAVEQEMLSAISSAFDDCRSTAEEATSESISFSYDAAADAVTCALLPLLKERVGPPLGDAEYDAARAEASRRATEGYPPGFRDVGKDSTAGPDGSTGDYLVWLQSMLEAERRGLPLVLVTGDEKDDWWWKHRNQLLGPRAELVKELKDRCGLHLVMVRPAQLIEHADVLSVAVTDDVRTDVERGTTNSEGAPEWSVEAVNELLRRLEAEGREQAQVIRFAAANDGTIDRELLYSICDYPPDRMLRGFTRPTARITKELQVEGMLDEGITPMLTPDYQTGVQALRFLVPDEVVQILQRSDGESDGSAQLEGRIPRATTHD